MPEPTYLYFARGAPPCGNNIGMDYMGTDVVGTVTGGNHNFCSNPESAYRSGAFDNIFQFEITYPGGTVQSAYCLEKGVRGPQGSPYRSMPVSQCMPGLSPDQIERINWILANSYPAIGADEMFACAQVDVGQSPVLNDDDAYAAVQVAVWSVINPPAVTDVGWQFFDCATGRPHVKSARLHQTVAYLYDGALLRAQEVELPADEGFDTVEEVQGCRVARVGNATLTDCGPGDMRMACGKVLYGPLMVYSDMPFELNLKPLCACSRAPGFITIADACGSPMTLPASGQEFYIAFPPKMGASCYELSLSVRQTVVTVAVMCNTDAPPRLQAVAAVPRVSTRRASAKLCLCFAPPCPHCRPPLRCVCVEAEPCPCPPVGHCPPKPCPPIELLLEPECESRPPPEPLCELACGCSPSPKPSREPHKRVNMRKRTGLQQPN